MAKKRLNKQSNRMRLYDTTISKSMTIPQLKKYIRQATEEINKSIKARGTGSEQLDKSINYLKKVGGVKKVKDKNKNIISKVGLSFSKKKKEDLLKQARMLKQHIGFDIETRSGKEYMQEKEAKAFKTFKKHTGIALSKEDYRRLVDILGDLGTTLVSQLTSDQVAEFFSRSKDKMSGNSLVELIIEVYNENDGLTKTEMLEAINDRLVEELENL